MSRSNTLSWLHIQILHCPEPRIIHITLFLTLGWKTLATTIMMKYYIMIHLEQNITHTKAWVHLVGNWPHQIDWLVTFVVSTIKELIGYLTTGFGQIPLKINTRLAVKTCWYWEKIITWWQNYKYLMRVLQTECNFVTRESPSIMHSVEATVCSEINV